MSSQNRYMKAWAAAAVLVFAAGCGPESPASSATPASPASPSGVAPVAGTPAAALAISAFEVQFSGIYRGVYTYAPKITLTEKSGTSAATVTRILLFLPNGDTDVIDGAGCGARDKTWTVPSGGTWNEDSVAYYCLDIGSSIDLAGSQVGLMVTFSDERGVAGQVSGSAAVGPAR